MNAKLFRRHPPAAFFLFLLAASVADAASPRILPLGDSITQPDSSQLSYRYWLWQKLVDTGAPFDLVGPYQDHLNGNPTWPNYKGLSFDQDHFGKWGWPAKWFLDYGTLETELANLPQKADIALVHLGHNDLGSWRLDDTPENTRDRLGLIVDKLREHNPNIRIFLAQLIPTGPYFEDTNTKITQFNALIPALAASKTTSESPVTVVDMNTGFDRSNWLTDDQIHPNATGEQFIAQKWFDAMAIPEPGTVVLLAVGGLSFVAVRRLTRKTAL